MGFHNHHGAHCVLVSPTSATLLFPDLSVSISFISSSYLSWAVWTFFLAGGSPATSTSAASLQTAFHTTEISFRKNIVYIIQISLVL